MTMDNNRSSKDYELEAEASRQRLAESLDELVDRLTPGQVFDEILTYAKAGNGTFFRALSNAARENPIPALMMGAGAMMFLSEKTGATRYVARRISDNGQVTSGSATHAALRQGSYAASRSTGSMARSVGSRVRGAFGAAGAAAGSVGDKVSEAGHSVQERAAAMGDRISDGMSTAADAARRTAHDVRDQISGAADRLQDGAASVAGTAQDYAASARDRIGDAADAVQEGAASLAGTAQDYAASARDRVAGAAGALQDGAASLAGTAQQYAASAKDAIAGAAGEAYDQGARTAQKATSKAKDMMNEQPLLVAALGLAVGAAIAAALPLTRRENELMGEASDSVKKAVSDAATQQFEAVTGAANRVAQGVKKAAEQEGLTPSAAVGAAREFGEKIKNVVSGATETGMAEARELAGTDKS